MPDFLITVEDDIGSTATIDLREIAAIHQDVEGDVTICLKGGRKINLQELSEDKYENLCQQWSIHVPTTL